MRARVPIGLAFAPWEWRTEDASDTPVLLRGVVEGVTYLGTEAILLREDAWDLADFAIGDAMEAEPADLVRALSDNPSERLNHAGIHPYFRWQLVDECGLTIAPSAPMAPGHIDRWMVYDAETFLGVVGGSVSESAVSWATPLGRTKRVVDVISPLLSGDRDRWAVWHYARLVDLALRDAS